ncbi:hypothetical protein C2845_PM01G08330 [Panicum miliaceum]|uniref:Uncharacterized protein n=1 Tax=Panicum miliaceum TaxID=4540 RepID=A0A3L6TT28_PANMI|nr:hypothetical protein C2845_PM01G08330 [Panicum miliaceum]
MNRGETTYYPSWWSPSSQEANQPVEVKIHLRRKQHARARTAGTFSTGEASAITGAELKTFPHILVQFNTTM